MSTLPRCRSRLWLLAAIGLVAAACGPHPVVPPEPPEPLDPAKTRTAMREAVAMLEQAEADGRLDPQECEAVTHAFRAVHDPRNPETADGLFDAGVVWERCGRPDRAAATYREAIAAFPEHDSAHNNLGVLQWSAGELEGAVASFERAVKAAPEAPAPRNNLAAALRERYVQSGDPADFDRAERSLRSALAVDSDNPVSYENLARLYYDRGRAHDRSYLLLADLVITQATRILGGSGGEQQRATAELYNLRGLLLMEEGDQVMALRAFKQAIAIDEGHAEAHLNIAMIALRFRDYATAEASLEQALRDREHADDVAALLSLGVAQRGQRNYADAEQTLTRAHELAPTDPRALYNLGILYHEHIAPQRSQSVDDKTGALSFDDAPYLDARGFFERFAKSAGDRYPREVADARARVASIDQFLRDIKEIEDLEALRLKLEAEAERQREAERQELLEIERRARQAHDAAGTGSSGGTGAKLGS